MADPAGSGLAAGSSVHPRRPHRLWPGWELKLGKRPPPVLHAYWGLRCCCLARRGNEIRQHVAPADMLQLNTEQPLRKRCKNVLYAFLVAACDLLSQSLKSKHPRCADVVPVTEHGPLGSRGCDWQLEGCVEVVLLLIRAMNHLPSSDHQETRISQIGRVQPVALPVQNHDAGRAATCRHGRKNTVSVPGSGKTRLRGNKMSSLKLHFSQLFKSITLFSFHGML